MLKWEILDFHRLETQGNPWISHLRGLFLFLHLSFCLSVQLPTAALTTLQQTGAWSTGPDSAQGANYSITATAVTAWSDQATLPAGSTWTGSSSGTHHRLFVKVNICINMNMYLLSTSSYSLICMPLLKGGGFRIEGFVVGIHEMFFDGRKELTDPESFSDSGKHSAFIAVGSVNRLRLYQTRLVYK